MGLQGHKILPGTRLTATEHVTLEERKGHEGIIHSGYGALGHQGKQVGHGPQPDVW